MNRTTTQRMLIMLALFGATTLPSIAQQRVRLATCAPQGTSYHQALQSMAQRWRQAGVEMTIYPDCTMGSEEDMVRRMRAGQIQAALVTTTGLAEIDKAVTSLQFMPMVFRNYDELDYVRNQLRPELERRMLQKGFVVLFWSDSGWMHFFTRRPAVRPDDFRNLTTFVTASDPAQLEMMKRAGFPCRPLEWPDALTGLQTGMIDAVPTAPMIALSFQLNTAVHHMLALKWAPLVGGAVITKAAWDQIPETKKQQLLQAAADAGNEIQTRARAEALQAIEVMKAHGMQVHEVSPAIEADWRKVAETMYPEIRGSMVPSDFFDLVQQILASYRSAKGTSAP